jgi:hypothetical protein
MPKPTTWVKLGSDGRTPMAGTAMSLSPDTSFRRLVETDVALP